MIAVIMAIQGALEKGVLPGYASEASVKGKKRIGVRRPLSVSEEANLLITGLSRRDAANMSSKQLKELADAEAEQSNTLLGS